MKNKTNTKSNLCENIVNKPNLEIIKAIQLDSNVVIGETLESISANGLMIAEAFRLYMAAMNWGEGDRFFRKTDDGEIEEYNFENKAWE